MITRIRPSFFSDVSGWDITTAYTIHPSTRALFQRVKRTRSLISREICSVFLCRARRLRGYTRCLLRFLFITRLWRLLYLFYKSYHPYSIDHTLHLTSSEQE